jgi:peptidoglycan hydrolase-like protein with peptidoglycan-binding domain
VPAAVPAIDGGTVGTDATVPVPADPTPVVAVEPPVSETVPEMVVDTAPPLPAGVPVPPLDVPLPALGTADGPETARLQQRLLDLGFWVQSTDGTYGLTTRQGVMAFQKYFGLTTSGAVDYATAAFLSQATERARAGATDGTLVEVDKRRQLLFLVVDGATTWVINASTGRPRAARGLVGRRSRPDLPAEVLQGWRRRARLEQRAELPGLARLRAGERSGDGLHLGQRPHPDAHPGVGALVTSPLRARQPATRQPASSAR